MKYIPQHDQKFPFGRFIDQKGYDHWSSINLMLISVSTVLCDLLSMLLPLSKATFYCFGW